MSRASLTGLIVILTFSLTVWAKDVPLIPSGEVAAASGKANYRKSDNHRVQLSIATRHIPAPQELVPAENMYVVWIIPPKGGPQDNPA